MSLIGTPKGNIWKEEGFLILAQDKDGATQIVGLEGVERAAHELAQKLMEKGEATQVAVLPAKLFSWVT